MGRLKNWPVAGAGGSWSLAEPNLMGTVLRRQPSRHQCPRMRMIGDTCASFRCAAVMRLGHCGACVPLLIPTLKPKPTVCHCLRGSDGPPELQVVQSVLRGASNTHGRHTQAVPTGRSWSPFRNPSPHCLFGLAKWELRFGWNHRAIAWLVNHGVPNKQWHTCRRGEVRDRHTRSQTGSSFRKTE